MNARTPAYVSDELEHANEQRARMVPQIEATRAMLAALERLAGAADAVGVQFFDTDSMSWEVDEMQKATEAARAAIAQAEAAGIGGDK